jgi:hypothetical protein
VSSLEYRGRPGSTQAQPETASRSEGGIQTSIHHIHTAVAQCQHDDRKPFSILADIGEISSRSSVVK